MSERLQKVLARAGLGSRRAIEKWILAGRIKINDRIAKIGDGVQRHDMVFLDGKRLNYLLATKASSQVLLYNKPIGEISTRSDPEGRPTVYDRLPKLRSGRWLSIGRLDLNTSGLLLFTNDGELANNLMHPRYAVEREYAVRILGQVDYNMLKQLQNGVQLEDGMAKFASITDCGGEGANHWYQVVVTSGRNQLVRRLWQSQGVVVSRLIRIRYGDILLPRNLRMGRLLELSPVQIATLKNRGKDSAK